MNPSRAVLYEIRADGRLFSVGHQNLMEAEAAASSLLVFGFSKIEIIDSHTGKPVKLITQPSNAA